MNYFNGEGTLYQAPQTEFRGPSMGYIFKTKTGKIVAIDGGIIPEAENVYNYLKANSKGKIVIDAWFITHPHSDHIGAIVELLKTHGKEIEIKQMLFKFPPKEFFDADNNTSDAEYVLTQELLSLIKEFNIKTVTLNEGQIYTYDGLKIKVLFTYKQVLINALNNASSVLKAELGGTTILFLGDLGAECGDMLLNSEYGKEVECDIVQMAHHGQNGVKEDFYAKTKAKASLWPTPNWLYTSPNETHPFLHCDIARGWLKKYNVNIEYIAKDGEIILS